MKEEQQQQEQQKKNKNGVPDQIASRHSYGGATWLLQITTMGPYLSISRCR